MVDARVETGFPNVEKIGLCVSQMPLAEMRRHVAKLLDVVEKRGFDLGYRRKRVVDVIHVVDDAVSVRIEAGPHRASSRSTHGPVGERSGEANACPCELVDIRR